MGITKLPTPFFNIFSTLLELFGSFDNISTKNINFVV